MPGDADLEIGLRWDRGRKGLDANLRFINPGTGTDLWKQPEEPISIDFSKLGRLSAADEAEYGVALTEMVLRPQDLGKFYDEVIAATDEGDLTLHLRLHVNGPPRFHAIRWESLRDPRTGDPLATRARVLVSRYLSSPDWRPVPLLPKHDLRALVVVAGPQDIETFRPNDRGLAAVDVDAELERARTALAGFYERKELAHGDATLGKVLGALEQEYDVLYLVCHGALVGDVPRIYLESPEGQADPIDGRQLVERLLALKRRPTIAMLCSCQSANRGNELWSTDEGELSALGPQLAEAGIPAIVGMQGNISMETAATFVPAFFEALAEDGIVDRSMASARRAVRERRDWWVPVLYSRLRSGRTYYRPEFTTQADYTWETLGLQMEQVKCTPVLGPGLGDRILGSRENIARAWVKRWQMPLAPYSQGDLAQVAQYLRVRSAPGTVRTQLAAHLSSEISRRIKNAGPGDPFLDLPLDASRPEAAILEVGKRLRENDPGDPYRVMAALKVSVYITTAWTGLLQEALRDAGREPLTMTFPWNPDALVDVDALDHFEEPTVERPLVYHLFGHLEDLDSIVLTEEDYFGWFTAWITRRKDVPPVVSRSLLQKSLLFLGFRLDDWDFRVVFHSVKSFGGSALLTRNVHVGVQLSPENQMIEPEAAQEYLESYFGNDKVNIYWGDTRRFLDEFRARTKLET